MQPESTVEPEAILADRPYEAGGRAAAVVRANEVSRRYGDDLTVTPR
jgi:hypothetical protein